MEINDLMTPEAIIPALRVTSKKQALQEISKRAAELTRLQERTIFEVLVERERLGTTGVGHGPPEGAGPGLPAAARQGDLRQAARQRQRRRDLRAAHRIGDQPRRVAAAGAFQQTMFAMRRL